MTSSDQPSRRTVIKAAAGLGAAAAAGTASPTPAAAAVQPRQRDVITRVVPRTGERVPVVGVGSFMTFDKKAGAPRAHLAEVLRRFVEGGGKLLDTSPLYGYSEVNIGDFINSMGVADQLFIANKAWSTGEYLSDTSHISGAFEQSRRRLWRDKIDLMQVHSLTNAEMNVPILRNWKKEGRIRFVGVTHHVISYYHALDQWIRTGDVDFVQVRYSIFMRAAEERILPLAAEHKVAVLVNMALEKARLHRIVEGRRLPAFARRFDCENWSQFFLKYVISHPAVTCVLPATTNPDHMAENLGAMRGRLPDESTRGEMVEYMKTVPGFDQIDSVPWYPGKTFDGMVKL
ncbi:diketogulonate reductase-like aldo/keto reductase [Herbihabitans rhizosphaerae]|uniref:Diketogulonate reductase-like aldo/keto reductase n=1 Tax=Herbihabitans rhizosphaerae TaxID=1872711 RepID=A0A4Q7KC59_9PSEU|nr:aldo/keto reductase [Herbihabitans rhizosphaerae]RZS30568.1 diketogulonate reductase-like aldo/keto reductase [Herbihabitans rhizosphaerae]